MFRAPTHSFLRQKLDQMPHEQRVSHYLGRQKILATTIFGKKIYLNSNDLSLTPHLLVDGYWEKWITKEITMLIKPGMRVCEVGANVGYYSLLLAELVGESGHLTAFEANPELADMVFHSLHLNGFQSRSTVHSIAVFDRKKKIKFHVFERHQGSSSIFA